MKITACQASNYWNDWYRYLLQLGQAKHHPNLNTKQLNWAGKATFKVLSAFSLLSTVLAAGIAEIVIEYPR
ncbi:hypothetical protein ACWKW6_32445 [Dyadobacter jiangsuensis]